MNALEPSARRQPVQARSRERFEQILDAAAALIEQRGLAPLSMTDIAERSDMGLTALYRYFPNKQAVLHELALRVFASDAEILDWSALPETVSLEEFIANRLTEFWRRNQISPLRQQLRAAIHADAHLSQLDLQASRNDAERAAALVASATGRTDLAELRRQALLLIELAEGLVHLMARSPEAEAQAMLEDFSHMASRLLSQPQP